MNLAIFIYIMAIPFCIISIKEIINTETVITITKKFILYMLLYAFLLSITFIGFNKFSVKEDVKVDSTQIVSINDNDLFGKQFISNSIDNNNSNYHYKTKDGSIKTVSSKDTEIFETDKKYRIEKWVCKQSFLFLYDDTNVHYKIYIPQNNKS